MEAADEVGAHEDLGELGGVPVAHYEHGTGREPEQRAHLYVAFQNE